MSKADTNWLINQLNHVKSYKLPVIVIDYLPPDESKMAIEDAKKIRELGFIPYITDMYLQTFEAGICQTIQKSVK